VDDVLLVGSRGCPDPDVDQASIIRPHLASCVRRTEHEDAGPERHFLAVDKQGATALHHGVELFFTAVGVIMLWPALPAAISSRFTLKLPTPSGEAASK